MRLHEGLEEMQRLSLQMLKRVLFNLLVIPFLAAVLGLGAVYFIGWLILTVVIPIAKALS